MEKNGLIRYLRSGYTVCPVCKSELEPEKILSQYGVNMIPESDVVPMGEDDDEEGEEILSDEERSVDSEGENEDADEFIVHDESSTDREFIPNEDEEEDEEGNFTEDE
jgi:hypothetical protein